MELINNIVLVSGIQQSDSVIHVSILFQILFPFRLLQNIEQSSLCFYSRSLLVIHFKYSSVTHPNSLTSLHYKLLILIKCAGFLDDTIYFCTARCLKPNVLREQAKNARNMWKYGNLFQEHACPLTYLFHIWSRPQTEAN